MRWLQKDVEEHVEDATALGHEQNDVKYGTVPIGTQLFQQTL